MLYIVQQYSSRSINQSAVILNSCPKHCQGDPTVDHSDFVGDPITFSVHLIFQTKYYFGSDLTFFTLHKTKP